MRPGWRLRLAPGVDDRERDELSLALSQRLSQECRILVHHSRVKRFYRVQVPGLCIFVKIRDFNSLRRRLGRALRTTKEEKELANCVRLRALGVPCPRPLSSARLQAGFLPMASALLTEFIPESRPLREALLQRRDPAILDRLMAFLGTLRQARVVHQDLQWDNLLVGEREDGFPIYLVDSLHVRLMAGAQDQGFAQSLAWFLRFMILAQAPQGLIQGFLEKLGSHDLCAPLSPGDVLERAMAMCAL